jgi:hypothetical protein
MEDPSADILHVAENEVNVNDGDMESMKISTEIEMEQGSSVNDSKLVEKWRNWQQKRLVLPRRYKLVTDEEARKYSIWSLRFVVLCSAMYVLP